MKSLEKIESFIRLVEFWLKIPVKQRLVPSLVNVVETDHSTPVETRSTTLELFDLRHYHHNAVSAKILYKSFSKADTPNLPKLSEELNDLQKQVGQLLLYRKGRQLLTPNWRPPRPLRWFEIWRYADVIHIHLEQQRYRNESITRFIEVFGEPRFKERITAEDMHNYVEDPEGNVNLINRLTPQEVEILIGREIKD